MSREHQPSICFDTVYISAASERADSSGKIVEDLVLLHFNRDPQISIIDSLVSSPLPSSSGRPPIEKGGDDGRVSTT